MSHRYRSGDGLVTSSEPGFVALWDGIGQRMAEEKSSWTQALREMGVKLAHPDDGWVHRDAEEPYLSLSWYPQFNDDPQEGDYIALGWPFDHYRLVRVTRVERGSRFDPTLTRYFYKDTGLRVPPEPETPTIWQRV